MKQFNVILLIQLTSFLVFVGRAYQFFFFETPFQSVLSDEGLMTPIIRSFSNLSWHEFTTSAAVNSGIESFIKVCAIFLLLAAFASVFWFNSSLKKLKKWVMATGIGLLVLIGLGLVKEKNYDILQFFELTIQLACPLSLFFLSEQYPQRAYKLIFLLKCAIALTFITHGFFALGLPYVPDHFIEMTVGIMSITEQQAGQLLFVAGLFDVVASILLFVPKTGQYALFYMFVWGCLTALARIVSAFDMEFFLESLHSSAYLTIYRLPHGLLPAAVLILGLQRRKVKPVY
ncbi:MAG: hypothetical protein AAF519_15320 [Bacteroidota bacterium]